VFKGVSTVSHNNPSMKYTERQTDRTKYRSLYTQNYAWKVRNLGLHKNWTNGLKILAIFLTRENDHTTKLQKSWHYVLCTCCVANTAWRSYSLVPISKVGLSLTWHIEPFRTKFGSVLFGFEKNSDLVRNEFGSVRLKNAVLFAYYSYLLLI